MRSRVSTARTTPAGHAWRWGLVALAVTSGCSSPGGGKDAGGITPATHTYFPITASSAHPFGKMVIGGTIACESCHPSSADSFKAPDCLSCHAHAQAVTDLLHKTTAKYAYQSVSCLGCHPTSDDMGGFDHAQVTTCAVCHDVGAAFAKLPKAGFTHPPTNGDDCAACHVTDKWTVP